MASDLVVLLGASGWLGRAFAARLPDAVVVPTAQVLAQGAPAVLSALHRNRPDDQLVVVNAAGRKHGTAEQLAQLNAELVVALAGAVTEQDGWLLQLGSAAEYGLGANVSWIDDRTPCRPRSPYGETKLAGTRAAQETGRAAVLRLFNVFDNPPQVGSPLEDIFGRVRKGVAANEPIEVLSAGTARDYSTRDFVTSCVEWAVKHRPIGTFNIASGVGVRVGDLASAIGLRLGSTVSVRDLEVFPATTIVADPDPWLALSGLAEVVDAARVAEVLLPNAVSAS